VRPRLLIASANPAKVREFRQILGDDRFEWTDLTAIAQTPSVGSASADRLLIPPVEETGQTFRANACLKATCYAKQLGAWSLADDSGLAVDILGGAPGVLSARWAQLNNAGQGDRANNETLLRQLQLVPDNQRTARFVCCLALADPKARIILTTQDSLEGRILPAPRGANGFGYDPLFLVPDLGKTTAELSADEKHKISHRGKALRRMRALMDLVK